MSSLLSGLNIPMDISYPFSDLINLMAQGDIDNNNNEVSKIIRKKKIKKAAPIKKRKVTKEEKPAAEKKPAAKKKTEDKSE